MNRSPGFASPPAAAAASRDALPVPHGERSTRPGGMIVAPCNSPAAFRPVIIT